AFQPFGEMFFEEGPGPFAGKHEGTGTRDNPFFLQVIQYFFKECFVHVQKYKRPRICGAFFKRKPWFPLFYQVDLNPSVLLSTSIGVVGGDRLGLTVSNGGQSVGSDAFVDKEVPY